MLIVSFGIRGFVHNEFILGGQAVNKEYYFIVLKRFREKIRQKQPDLLKNNS